MGGARAEEGRDLTEAGKTAHPIPLQATTVAVLLLVVLAPLVSVSAMMYPSIVSKALLVRSAVGVGTAFLVWMLATNAWEAVDSRDPVLWSLIGLTAISGLSGLAGSSPHHSFFGDFERTWGAVQWGYLTLLYLLLRTFLGKREWRLVLRAALFVAVGVAAFAALEFVVQRIYPSFAEQQTVGTLGVTGYLGSYMVLAAGLALAVADRFGSTARSALEASAAVALFVIVLLLTGNRAALLGAVAGAAVGSGFFLLARVERPIAVASWLGAGFTLAFAALWSLWLLSPELLLEIPVLRRVVLFEPSSGSVAGRLGAWEAGLEGFVARPLTGWGPENFDLLYARFVDPEMHRLHPGNMTWDRAHNVIVGNLAEVGPAGLAAYLALWGSILLTGVRSWREDRLQALEAAALLAAFTGYFVYVQFWFEDHSTAVLLITLAAYLRYRRRGARFFRLERSESRSLPRSALWGTVCLGIAGAVLWVNGRSALAAASMVQANGADEVRTKVQHFEEARRLEVPERRSIAIEYASSMADLGLESAPAIRASDSLRTLYSRGVEGADRALEIAAEQNPLDAWVDAERGRLAAAAALVFAGEGIQNLARESLKRAVAKSPALLAHRHTLATTEALLGDREAARTTLREALGVYDGHGRTYYLLSRMSGSMGEGRALTRLRQSFWLDYYPEEKGYLRRTIGALLERREAEEAERLLTVYVASRYLPGLREQGDYFAAEREEFRRSLAAEIRPSGLEDRPYRIDRRDLPLLAMWPRAAMAAGDCRRAVMATGVLLNGLSERQRTASLRPTIARQFERLRDRCRE